MLVFTGLALALAGDALRLDSQRLDFRFIGENPTRRNCLTGSYTFSVRSQAAGSLC